MNFTCLTYQSKRSNGTRYFSPIHFGRIERRPLKGEMSKHKKCNSKSVTQEAQKEHFFYDKNELASPILERV
jgi:hypothetical protein